MKQIIIYNGLPESGKDTFVNYCIEFLPKNSAENFSIVDPFKNILALFGWGGEKTPEFRKLLCDMENISNDLSEFGIRNLGSRIINSPKEVFFVAIRKPDRISGFSAYMQNMIFCKITTLLVERPGHTINSSVDADNKHIIYNQIYNFKIKNNGSLTELKREAKKFVLANFFEKRKETFLEDILNISETFSIG